MEKAAFDFHIAEYNRLGELFSSNVKGFYNAVVYVSISNAFIVAWILSEFRSSNFKSLMLVACWLPLMLTAIGWSLALLRHSAAVRIANYLDLLEDRYSQGDLGWSKYCKQNPRKFRTKPLFNIVFLVQISFSIFFGAIITWKMMLG